MTLLLGSNSPKVIATHGSTTTAGYYDSTYVSRACKISNNFAGPMIHFPVGATDTVWLHFKMRLSTASNYEDGNAGPWVYDAAGNRLFYFEVSNGSWRATFNGDSEFVDGYRYIGTGLRTIDLKFQIAGGVLYGEFWLDGVLVYGGSSPCVNGRVLPTKLHFHSADSGDVWISELMLMDTPTIGRHLKELKPAGQGADDAWTGGFAELGDTIDETFATTQDPDLRESSTIDAYSGPVTGGIEAVMVESIGSKSIGSPANLAHYLKIAGVDYDGALSPLDDVPTRTDELWSINPATGLAWTFADLAGLEIGLKSGA